jgi:uncharacterized membrane protein YphA (DoxX/SURF4 family)
MTAMHETVRTARNGSRRARSPIERWTIALRWAAGIVFVVFGAGKFVNHLSEISSFRSYGLPLPSAFVYAIGVLELVGGLMLASGVLVRLAALALAADMVGAIVVSGIGRGENISLTLAPVLLAAMIFLIRFAGGTHAAHPYPRLPSESACDG